MEISKIESPSWSEDIKLILLPHSESFEFNEIPDNEPMDLEWWKITNQEGVTLGVGSIDFRINEFGYFEGEISLCVSDINKEPNVGSTLLAFLEDECKSRNTDITSILIKKKNPEYEKVVNWFMNKNYQFEYDFGKDTYWIKNRTVN